MKVSVCAGTPDTQLENIYAQQQKRHDRPQSWKEPLCSFRLMMHGKGGFTLIVMT